MRNVFNKTSKLAALTLGICLAPALAAEPVSIHGATFKSVLPPMEGVESVTIDAFRIDTHPVTNEEFLAFVTRNPQWRRDQAVGLLVGTSYLEHWQGPLTLGYSAAERQPVTNVSWFAARAYCESHGGRLPTWHEWEYLAAADEHDHDARHKPEWRQQILGWYAETGGKELLRTIGMRKPNAWGVYDLHGLIWEWAEDYNALLVSGDNREQTGADKLEFCGAGAVTMEQKENYAVLMRVAMLSSLKGKDTTRNLGFRCAYDAHGE